MEQKQKKEERYHNIDGLRACAAIGILMMHVLANGGYALEGFIFQRVIPSFTDLVFLFMMISSFAMCCGYYERMISGNINLGQFYKKRFSKVWPFFAALTIMDIVVSPSVASLYEAFANLTLCFGLLPNANISVIGVGWTLGVIFVFYLLFPFFCFLLSDCKRGWLAFFAALLMNIACRRYFFDDAHMLDDFMPRSNFMYCAVYFVAGGLVWRYREKMDQNWSGVVALAAAAVGAAAYFAVGSKMLVTLVLYVAVLIYAISRKNKKGLLNNRIVGFISGISMEVYLCHMVVFRVIEKMGWLGLFEHELLSYLATVTITIAGSVIFAVCAKMLLAKAGACLEKMYIRVK